jgi:hypothetical protein
MSIPVTVLAIRIRAAETAEQVKDLMKYDLPTDAVTRALCERLMVALEGEEPLPCPNCGALV